MTYSVFDIATRLFKVSEVEQIPAISLQKLMYFAYGWYGRLTGQYLFTQQFYAMQHGPVVGELLSLHKSSQMVDRSLVEEGRDLLQDSPLEDDGYVDDILHALWTYYGYKDRWELVDITHAEKPWIDAWTHRRESSRRALLDGDSIIHFYIERDDAPEDLLHDLPLPQVTFLRGSDAIDIERIPSTVGDSARELFAERGLLQA